VPIQSVVGSRIELKRDFACCPFHDERSPSLHIYRQQNIWRCFGCSAKGDTIKFVQLYDRVGFVDAVDRLCGSPTSLPARPVARAQTQHRRRDSEVDEAMRTAAARELWERAKWRERHLYFHLRGISVRAPQTIRRLDELWCAEARQNFAAIICAIHDGAGALCAVQRIWVDPRQTSDGGKTTELSTKASTASPKKTLGPMRDGAVHLGESDERRRTLGIAEGVETALACQQMFKIPMYAALGAARLGKLALPDFVRQLYIFADNGSAGAAAADNALRSYQRQDLQIHVEFPEPQFKDFNDQLMAMVARERR
jgi:DNA primase